MRLGRAIVLGLGVLLATTGQAAAQCVLTCPSDISVTPDVGTCAPIVNYSPPSAGGVCGTITCVPASGSSFQPGTTPVTCTDSLTATSCSFNITVAGTPFSITCPADITVSGSPIPAVVNYPAPNVTSSACNGAVTVVCAPASGSSFPGGNTPVTCTATDEANATVSCSFGVNVLAAVPFGPEWMVPATFVALSTYSVLQLRRRRRT